MSILNTQVVYLCVQVSTFVKHVLHLLQILWFHGYVLFLENSDIQSVLVIMAIKNGAILLHICYDKGKFSQINAFF